MTEEQLDRVAASWESFEELLEEFNLTKEEVFGILYETGMLDEDLLEELCPL